MLKLRKTSAKLFKLYNIVVKTNFVDAYLHVFISQQKERQGMRSIFRIRSTKFRVQDTGASRIRYRAVQQLQQLPQSAGTAAQVHGKAAEVPRERRGAAASYRPGQIPKGTVRNAQPA